MKSNFRARRISFFSDDPKTEFCLFGNRRRHRARRNQLFGLGRGFSDRPRYFFSDSAKRDSRFFLEIWGRISAGQSPISGADSANGISWSAPVGFSPRVDTCLKDRRKSTFRFSEIASGNGLVESRIEAAP